MIRLENVATVTLARKWGRGYRKVVCDVAMETSDVAPSARFYLITNESNNINICLVGEDTDSFTSVLASSNNEIRKELGNAWYVWSFVITPTTEPTDPTDPTDPTEPTAPTEPTDPTEPTESTESTESTLQEVAETAVAKLDSVVETKHTAKVDRFYIHNYKNGVIRLYWFNKSALACGFKTIVYRDGVETVVRNERFRDFIQWEKSRESYTKYCKANALKGGE